MFHGWTQTNASGNIAAKYEVVTDESGEHWQKTTYNADGTVKEAATVYENALKNEAEAYTLTADFNSGDTFTANYKAQVVFHVLANGTKDSAKPEVTYPVTVEYFYKEKLRYINDPYIDGSVFQYWTKTECTTEYESATGLPTPHSERIAIENPVDLYAVLIDAVSANIHVSIQSVAKDDNLNNIQSASAPEGLATSVITGNNSVTLDVISNDKRTDGYATPYQNDGSYRFLGWWESTDNGVTWKQISQAESSDPYGADNRKLVLKDVDLTTPHYYQARYEYRVRLFVPAKFGSNYHYGPRYSGSLYRTYWKAYNTSIITPENLIPTNVNLPIKENGAYFKAVKWTENLNVKDANSYDFSGLKGLANNASYTEFSGTITKPTDLAVLVSHEKQSADTSMLGTTDFPNTDAAEAGIGEHRSLVPIGTPYELKLKPNYNFFGYEQYELNDNSTADVHFKIKGTDWSSGYDWTAVGNDGWYQAKIYHGVAAGSGWDLSSSNLNVISARISANIYQYGKNETLMSMNGDKTIEGYYHNPAALNKNATATRKYDSLLFNKGDAPTATEAPLGHAQVDIVGSNDPVGLGTVKRDDPSMYVDGYKFLGWTAKYNEAPFAETEWNSTAKNTTGDRPIDQAYIVKTTDQAMGRLLAADERVHSAMWLYPVYAEFKINTRSNLNLSENDGTPTYSIDKDDQTDRATITIPVRPEGRILKDIDIYEVVKNSDGTTTEKLIMTLESDGSDTYKTPELDPDKEYTIQANYRITVTYHNIHAGEDQTREYRGGDLIGTMPASELFDAFGAGCIFKGWTETKPEDDKLYIVAGTDTTYVTSEDLVEHHMDLYPVYVVPTVTVYAYLNDKTTPEELEKGVDCKIEVSQGGGYRIAVPTTYTFKNGTTQYGICNISQRQEDGTYKFESDTRNFRFTPKAGEEYVFRAVYGPTVTYKRPKTDENGNLVYKTDKNELEYVDTVTENVPYGTQKKLYYYNIETTADGGKIGVIDVPRAAMLPITEALVASRYEFKKIWGTEICEDAAEAQTAKEKPTVTVESNIDLYPVIGPAEYVKVYSNLRDDILIRVKQDELVSTGLTAQQIKLLNPDAETNKDYTEFVGFALVDCLQLGVPKCEGLYPDAASLKSIDDLAEMTRPDTKKLYAVWSQQKTVGAPAYVAPATAQGYENGAMRSLTAVNTTILNKVGITVKDNNINLVDKFKRGALFALTADLDTTGFDFSKTNEAVVDIECDTSAAEPVWIGNKYYSEAGWDVFSTAGQLNENSPLIGQKISSKGYLVFHYTGGTDKTVYASFDKAANSAVVTKPETEQPTADAGE